MRHLSKLGLSVAGILCITYCMGCEEATVEPQGSGGTGGGGKGGSGGVGAGGAQAGGTTETGGTAENGGAPGSGGKTQAGGTTGRPGGSATDGGTGPGGRPGPDGSTGTGGATTDDGGPGRDGRATDGRGGGRTGSGGGPGTGGTVGSKGGSTGSTGPLKKWFGNIDTRTSIRSDFATMWDQFSPENAGKWGEVQGGGESSFKWTALDKMYEYCEKNNIIFKEHCFIWGSQQPNWVKSSNAETAVKNWMKEFCTRYPNTRVIDVVNEPLHPVPAYRDGIGGSGSSGWDWIVNAVKWAREYCPNAILVVNDYNTIEYSNENGRIISLINAVTKAGAPLDAVGAQSHDIAKVNQSTMTSYGQKIIDQTGLPLHITEMDIGIADDNQQATRMKEFVTWAWENPKVSGITYWGYIVGATWRSNTGLMTDSGSKRPALTWLLSYLKR